MCLVRAHYAFTLEAHSAQRRSYSTLLYALDLELTVTQFEVHLTQRHFNMSDSRSQTTSLLICG